MRSEELWKPKASARRVSNLRRGESSAITSVDSPDRRNSDVRAKLEESDIEEHKYASAIPESRGRTDTAIAQLLEIGGKDLYRQARTIWRLAQSGDIRAKNALVQLDARTKTVHAAYKDLRRRARFSADFRLLLPMTFGRFGTTVLSASLTLEQSHRQSSRTHPLFHTPGTHSSLIPWLAEVQRAGRLRIHGVPLPVL